MIRIVFLKGLWLGYEVRMERAMGGRKASQEPGHQPLRRRIAENMNPGRSKGDGKSRSLGDGGERLLSPGLGLGARLNEGPEPQSSGGGSHHQLGPRGPQHTRPASAVARGLPAGLGVAQSATGSLALQPVFFPVLP